MKMFGKLVTSAAVMGGVIGLGALIRHSLGRRQKPAESAVTTGAGSMSVGVVDEVELSGGLARPMRPGDYEPTAFDPEEVPSEHAEINELRTKMPFG